MEIASQLKKYLESLKTIQQGEEHMLQIDKKGKNFKMYNGSKINIRFKINKIYIIIFYI